MIKPDSQPAPDEPAWWFVIASGELLYTARTDSQQPAQPPHGTLTELPFPELRDYPVLFIGELRERACYVIIADHADPNFAAVGEFGSVRELIVHDDEALFAVAARAKQVADFVLTHRYCGRCGARMDAVDWELAMQCGQCQHRCYPRIAPCVIVAIRKQNQILLARGKRHPEGLFSVLAGFVESGETLEQALHREVYEEAGIRVKNLRYVASQPWPFPHSLMVGFTADWASGDIRLDPFELEAGDWFNLDELPRTPPAGTIAHRLIMSLKSKK